MGNEAIRDWKTRNNLKIEDQMDMLARLDQMTDAQLEELKILIEAQFAC